MLKKVPGVLLVLCILTTTSLLLSACQEKEVAGGQLPTFQAGDQWVWKYVMDTATYTLTEEVTGEETVEGRVCYVIDMSFDPVMSSTHDGVVYTTTGMRYWSDKATGLLGIKHEYTTKANEQTHTSSVIYSYSPWISIFPLEIGKKVETERTATNYYEGEQYGEIETATEKYTVVSKEEITINVGTFNCWKMTYYDSTSDTTQTMWWSDEVKSIVKSIDQDGKTIMELQSYSVK